MKELGMTDNAEGIKTTFQEIFDISLKCKFPDCKHINETGCAVIEALNNGTIDKDSYDNYPENSKRTGKISDYCCRKTQKRQGVRKDDKELLQRQKK